MTTPPASPLSPSEAHIDELGELIAGLPGMLGFVPDDSLVISAFLRDDGAFLGPTIRVDLPGEADRHALVDQLGDVMERNDVVSVTLVVISDGNADPPGLPHSELIGMLAEEFADLGVRLTHAAWVPAIEHGGVWRCYQCDDCVGRIDDPRTSTIATLHAVEGMVTYASRAEMRDVLAPDDDDRVEHRAQLLAAITDSELGNDIGSLWVELEAAVEAASHDRSLPDLDDEQIVRLSLALAHSQVRDYCLTTSLTGRSPGAERLWTVLTRAAPASTRAAPACLLAVCAYLRGSAVLASMALEIALDAEPGLQLALLLRDAIDRGISPDRVRHLLVTSVALANGFERGEQM